jgi:hypothetical protein
MGHNYRVALAPTPDSEADPGPSTVVVKFPSADPTSRGTGLATGAYEREIRFYEHLAVRTSMRIPHCHAAHFDPTDGAFVVVMEDMAGWRQGDQIEGCEPAVAGAVIDESVRLHADFWGAADTLCAEYGWLTPPADHDRATATQALYRMVWPGFVQRFGHALSADALARGERVCDGLAAWASARRPPYTVVHGDYRLDNLLFGPDASQVCVVDWQTHNIGVGAADVAYFLGAGLLPPVRRAWEERLVRRWHDGLVRAGVADYGWNRAWEDYRATAWSGVIMAVVASMITEQTPRGDEMFIAMATRHLEQVGDLEADEFMG